MLLLDGQVHSGTHPIPTGNYVIRVGNYVSASPSELGNYVSADKEQDLCLCLPRTSGQDAEHVTSPSRRLCGQVGRRTDHRWRFDLWIGIGRQPCDVFAFLADIQDAEPIPRRARVRMVKEPSGPTAIGTRWHEQVRIVPGFWLHIESVVTQIAEPSRLGMDFQSHWFAGHLTYVIRADAGGSLLRQEETLQPRGPVRWLEKIIEPYLRRQLLRRLHDIRHLLEREDSARAASGTSKARDVG